MVQLLIEFGADPNQQTKPSSSRHLVYGGDTALHHAVSVGSAKMVKLLLAHAMREQGKYAPASLPRQDKFQEIGCRVIRGCFRRQ